MARSKSERIVPDDGAKAQRASGFFIKFGVANLWEAGWSGRDLLRSFASIFATSRCGRCYLHSGLQEKGYPNGRQEGFRIAAKSTSSAYCAIEASSANGLT